MPRGRGPRSDAGPRLAASTLRGPAAPSAQDETMDSSERPVRLTPACLRAIGEGRKSQMRAVVKDDRGETPRRAVACPVGSPGDFLRTEDGTVLCVAGVSIERLQEIGDRDLTREGGMWRETALPDAPETERQGFARWWDQVHTRPETKWAENPWVWVIDFERQ
jgi:hypothetical protein